MYPFKELGSKTANLIAGPSGHVITGRKLTAPTSTAIRSHLHPNWTHISKLKYSRDHYRLTLSTGREQFGVRYAYEHTDETDGTAVSELVQLYYYGWIEGDIDYESDFALTLSTGGHGTYLKFNVLYISGLPDLIELDETTRPDYVAPYQFYAGTTAN